MFSMLGHRKSGMTLIGKDVSEVRYDSIFDDSQISFYSEQLFHRSYWLTFAGDYQIEITQVGVHVECEAVRGNPARNVHTNSCHFTASRVYTGQTFDPKR